jgi:hypothetical protein
MLLTLPTCRQGRAGDRSTASWGDHPGAVGYGLILGAVLLRPPPALGPQGLVGHGQIL